MWKHIRRAVVIAGLIGTGAFWFATNSVPETIIAADGYLGTNLKWLGWKSPPDALASAAADHTVSIVSLVLVILGFLAAASWLVEWAVVARRPVSGGMNDYVRGRPRAPDPLAHIGTIGAAVFGIDGAETRVVIDIKNFGQGVARHVVWEAVAGWFPAQPEEPIPYAGSGILGVTEPGHSQNIALILSRPLTTADTQQFVRGGAGLYALLRIGYSDGSGQKVRRIAYYLDPQGQRLPDRWMMSVCPRGNDDD